MGSCTGISLLRYLQYLCVTGTTYLEILWQKSESERVPVRKVAFNFVLRNFFRD